jgi:hypothetical protein
MQCRIDHVHVLPRKEITEDWHAIFSAQANLAIDNITHQQKHVSQSGGGYIIS